MGGVVTGDPSCLRFLILKTVGPELFDRLDARQRNAVRQALAAAWHEGFEPTREHVEKPDRLRARAD